MVRKRNKDRLGNPWPEATTKLVWQKGEVIPSLSPVAWRKDICGSLMKFYEYNNLDSDYGWEIDHIKPESNGGSDDIINLQPLNWKNNADKDDKLNWRCPGKEKY
ncbi:MAG: HNH endonuclease [Bacteroidetes bacterium]|nr:MAG: HNH endonuclease [Bacteroidota bacterium]